MIALWNRVITTLLQLALAGAAVAVWRLAVSRDREEERWEQR